MMGSPPKSIEPEGLFDGLKPGAILIGAIVDNLATAVASTGLAGWLASEGAFSEDEEARRAAFDALLTQPDFLLWSLVVGIACTVLGAYVGATRAGSEHVRHGGWIAVTSAAMSLVVALLAGPAPGTGPPFWYAATGWLLLLPAGLLGGLLSKSRQEREL
jgi:peptidoglycan/LPS O-acetylase OafA/YrhL